MNTTTPTVRLRDVVPAESVDDLIDAVRAGLDHLYAQLQQAEQEAQEAERRLVALHEAPDGDGDRIEHLHASIDELAMSGNDYFRKEIDAAGARAAARLAEAHAHAEWLLVDAREQVAIRLSAPGDQAASDVLVRPPSVLGTPVVVADPTPPAVVAGEPEAEAERVQFEDFWQPEQEAAALRAARLGGTPVALVPVIAAAMAVLVLLVLVAGLAWIG